MKELQQYYQEVSTKGAYYQLDKSLLKLSAFNVEKTIKAISTNETTKQKNGFVDNFGRIIALVDQKVINKDCIYLLLEKSVLDSFFKHCEKYFKLGRIKTEIIQLKAFHIIGTTKTIGEIRFPQPIGYITAVSQEEEKQLQDLAEIPKQLYDIIRLENNISVQSIDFTNQMFLETNWDNLAVSYTKGCFLGQEILARVHNLGKPAKKLVRIMYENEPTENVLRNKEILGKITTKAYSFKYKKYLAFAIISGYDEKKVDGGVIS